MVGVRVAKVIAWAAVAGALVTVWADQQAGPQRVPWDAATPDGTLGPFIIERASEAGAFRQQEAAPPRWAVPLSIATVALLAATVVLGLLARKGRDTMARWHLWLAVVTVVLVLLLVYATLVTTID